MKNTIDDKVVIIGAGRLGTALAKGFLNAGFKMDQIILIQRNSSKRKEISAFNTFETLEEANIDQSTTLVVIAVKPKDIDGVLMSIDQNIPQSIPFVSLAAQVTVKQLKEKLKGRFSVFRLKPNVLVQYSKGAILIKQQNNDPCYEKVKSIFSLLGDMLELADEEKLETYSWYTTHLPCVFLPNLIQSTFNGQSEAEKEEMLRAFILGLDGVARYLKTFSESPKGIDEFIEFLSEQTMSPNGLNARAFAHLKQNDLFPITNESRQIYCDFGLKNYNKSV